MSSRDSVDQLRLATRGSALALRQASSVQEQLGSRRLSVELVTVETTGDQVRDELIHRLGTTGAFVRSLDEKVLDGELDAAVHSMKDMPTDQPPELVVAGVPERAAAADVLVTPRPDLRIEPLRGNVDTRVEKLLAPSLQREHQARIEAAEDSEDDTDADGNDDGDERESDRSPQEWFDDLAEIERRALERDVDVEYDAICLAEAGLDRSGLLAQLHDERLDPASFVPAPGQGAIAVMALDDESAELIYDGIDHPPSRVETTVERTILAELGGGCVAPIGIHASLRGDVVSTTVRVLSRDGEREVRESRDLPVERHAEAAVSFAADLAARGAADLIQDARREEPDDAKREEPDDGNGGE
ncbi:MAG: porphobilinogen deaminase [Halobacteriales archaeon SW_8_66_22]|nr:MAG: porphobilinogen deaminase [Halobacteriales archaeon SW_8_66_22]